MRSVWVRRQLTVREMRRRWLAIRETLGLRDSSHLQDFPALRALQMIGPLLHHRLALWQVLRPVVAMSRCVFFFVR